MSEQFSRDISESNADEFSDENIEQQDNDQFNDNSAPLQQNRDFFQLYGMFFCNSCKNMLDPTMTRGQNLDFKCKRCGIMSINFKNRQEKRCMLYSKSLQAGNKKIEIDSRMIFDPSMPRITIECPECSYHEAVYLVAPDDGQRKIVMKLICARGAQENIVKCGTKWDLDQDLEVFEDTVKGMTTQRSIESIE